LRGSVGEDAGGGEQRTSPELPCTMSWPSMGPLSDEPSPLRGILCEVGLVVGKVR
jgi:hypothetical protein